MQPKVLLPVATEAASANFAFQLTAVFVLWIFSQSAVSPLSLHPLHEGLYNVTRCIF